MSTATRYYRDDLPDLPPPSDSDHGSDMETNQLRGINLDTPRCPRMSEIPCSITYFHMLNCDAKGSGILCGRRPRQTRGKHVGGIRTFSSRLTEDGRITRRAPERSATLLFLPNFWVLHEIGFSSWHTCLTVSMIMVIYCLVISGRPKSFQFGSTVNNYVIHLVTPNILRF